MPLSNDTFRLSIKDDHMVFDNRFTGKILHRNKDDMLVDLDSGVMASGESITIVENCLFRNIANRTNTSIKQINSRMESLQVDNFDNIDVVVEVPLQDGLSINEGDTFIDDKDNKYRITAIDYTTLTTRYRLGLKANT